MKDQAQNAIRAIQAADEAINEIADGPAWLVLGRAPEAELRDIAKRSAQIAMRALGIASYAEMGLEEHPEALKA